MVARVLRIVRVYSQLTTLQADTWLDNIRTGTTGRFLRG